MLKLSADKLKDSYKYDEEAFGETDDGALKTTVPLKMYRKLQKVNSHNIRYMSSVFLDKFTALATGVVSIAAIHMSM